MIRFLLIIAKDYKDGKYPYGLKSVWAINVSFIKSNILEIEPDSPKRAELILNGEKPNSKS